MLALFGNESNKSKTPYDARRSIDRPSPVLGLRPADGCSRWGARGSTQQPIGDDLEQRTYGGRVKRALVSDDGDATDQPADLERVNALAERPLHGQTVEDPGVGLGEDQILEASGLRISGGREAIGRVSFFFYRGARRRGRWPAHTARETRRRRWSGQRR